MKSAPSPCARQSGQTRSRTRLSCFIDVSGTAELLARATIWPFYGIKASAWTTEADGSSAITIVDGIAALEPVEAGFTEDLVRAWFILTEQPVVTHLLAIPVAATEAEIMDARRHAPSMPSKAGYAERRDLRKALLADSSAEGDRLVDFQRRLRYELDDATRMARLFADCPGSGGTRYPLIREIPWWAPSSRTRTGTVRDGVGRSIPRSSPAGQPDRYRGAPAVSTEVGMDVAFSRKSENSSVLRYRSPVSHRITTISLPRFSSRRANSRPAYAAAPAEMPVSNPSVSISSRAASMAASPVT